MAIRLNLIRDMIWIAVSIPLTFIAGAISGLITGEKMSTVSIWYSAIFTAFIQFGYRIFFGMYIFWLVIIISNIILFFILPLWWQPVDKSKKIYCYIMFLMFNTILGFALYWVINLLS